MHQLHLHMPCINYMMEHFGRSKKKGNRRDILLFFNTLTMTIVLEVPKIWGCKLAIALCGWYLVLVSKVFTEIDFQNLFNLKGGLEKSMGFIKSLSQLTSYSASTTKSFSSSCFYWQKCKSCVARDLTLSKLCHPPIHHQQQPLIDNPSTFRKSTICIMHPNYNKKLV